MIVLEKTQLNYSKKTISYNLYYSLIKESFNKKDWAKLSNKKLIIKIIFNNELNINDALMHVKKLIKN
jgi:hypothetical protein